MDTKPDAEIGYLTPDVMNGIYVYGLLILRLVGTILGVAAFGISAQMIDFDVNKVSLSFTHFSKQLFDLGHLNILSKN